MNRIVTLPPNRELLDDGALPGGWWRDSEPDRILCELCPRNCNLKAGDRGFCFVRENRDGEMVLTTYGRSTGFCIDPIEKKPLNHFFPGTSVLSFGTAGCNLGCKFCQNHDISRARQVERLSQFALPETIANAADQLGCHSVAYTYNDPVIWAEYAIDTARACRERGIKSVAVTAGYITPEARAPFFEFFDAANVDLKAFSEEFYQHLTLSHLQPVLDTLRWLKEETDVWFEITNLIIPQANDELEEVRQMCDWVLENVGDEVPVHFTAFHPDFKMMDRPRTPPETLIAARDVARLAGLKYVYVGNVDDQANQSTYCGHCGDLVIQRNWYELGAYRLEGPQCLACGGSVPGRFGDAPGNWGRRRQPIDIARYALSPTTEELKLRLPVIVEPNESRSMSEANQSSDETSNDPASESAATAEAVPRLELQDVEKSAIHAYASEWVCAAAQRRNSAHPDPTIAGLAESHVLGAFVSLKRCGALRGCCGFVGKPAPLNDALKLSAVRTAREDVRMPVVSPTELPYLDLETWLLSDMELVEASGGNRLDHVEVGKHGLKLVLGDKAGLLLPSVAIDNGYDAEQFLDATCVKAGLMPNDWKRPEAELYRFEGQSFGGPIDPAAIDRGGQIMKDMLSVEQAQLLAKFCLESIQHGLRGSTSSYFAEGVPDGMVNALALSLPGAAGGALHVTRHAMRPGLPLQSTLHSMAMAVAQSVNSGQVNRNELAGTFGITLGYDMAMHGTVAEPDLRGIDATQRSVLVVERNRSAWMFDADSTAERLVEEAVKQAGITVAERARIFSMKTQSSGRSAAIVNRPQPIANAEIRQAAVAGTFYPGTAEEVSAEIDNLIPASRPTPARYRAAMVPHAGWRYSGSLAARTLARVDIPKKIIVLSPKHTQNGLDWAVSPCEKWVFPGGELKGDPTLARALVDNIPGLEMDASAHQTEHGIEVELPFIHRLAPEARVVGVAIGGPASYEQCEQFAEGLRSVLNADPDVLLLISSDMNHYATDEETRRLDAMAIECLESLDPRRLYDVCREKKITMCGRVPAVIVLETLSRMGRLKAAAKVGYATSADVSGDKDRVVGYCGMLFR